MMNKRLMKTITKHTHTHTQIKINKKTVDHSGVNDTALKINCEY